MISELNSKLIHVYTIMDSTADDQTDLVGALRKFAVVYYGVETAELISHPSKRKPSNMVP